MLNEDGEVICQRLVDGPLVAMDWLTAGWLRLSNIEHAREAPPALDKIGSMSLVVDMSGPRCTGLTKGVYTTLKQQIHGSCPVPPVVRTKYALCRVTSCASVGACQGWCKKKQVHTKGTTKNGEKVIVMAEIRVIMCKSCACIWYARKSEGKSVLDANAFKLHVDV